MTKTNEILDIFKQKNGIIELKDIREKGINKYHLLKLIENGKVEKLKHGIYKLCEYQIDDFVLVKKLVPKGVICMYSAWNYYELITYVPNEYHIAIDSKLKIKLPNYPPIKLYYWDSSILRFGLKNILIKDVNIEIYDIEKSVCDAVKFRNKIGKDILNEILNNYLIRQDRNINKLLRYSKKLRVYRVLINYLDVLI